MNILSEARNILGDSIKTEAQVEAESSKQEEIENAQVENEGTENHTRENEEEAHGNGSDNADEQNEGEESSPQEVAEGAGSEGDPEEAYTVAGLAEAIGFETKELYDTLEISLDDGQAPISLGELKNTHQNLVRENKETNEKLVAAQQAAQQSKQPSVSNEMMQIEVYVDQLNKEESAIDWADLEVTDPGQAALERSKYQQKRMQAQNAYSQLQANQSKEDTAHRNEESRKTLEAIPSWSDAGVRAKDQSEMMSYMQSIGFEQGEVYEFVDHRVYKMMKEIIDLRKLKSDASEAVNKVRKAPKMIKNSRKVTPKSKQALSDNLVSRARKTGSKQDQLAAAKSLFSGR